MHPIHLDPQLRDASFEEEAPLSLFAVLARGLLVPLRWGIIQDCGVLMRSR